MPQQHLELLSRVPEGGAAHPTPLVFVHGAWHAAWCWERFLPYFAERGFAAHALSLRNHGNSARVGSVRWTRQAAYVEDLRQVVADLPAPPVVVGHSMGGFVVQRYLAGGGPAAGAGLLASVPPGIGAWGATLRALRRHPLRMLQVNLQMSLYPLVSTPVLARDMLFDAAMPDEEVARHQRRLEDETYLGYLDMLGLALPDAAAIARRRLPVLVMGGSRDRIIGRGDLERTARAYAAELEVLPDVPHDLMLDARWERAAERLLDWLRRRLPVA